MTLIELAMSSAFLAGGISGTWIGATWAGPLGAVAGAAIGSLAGMFSVSALMLGILAVCLAGEWWEQRHSAALLRRLLAAPAEP